MCAFASQAYDLAGNLYGQEALTQLVNMMTEPEHKSKTMVILAGYKSDMNTMLSGNQGARSRFGQTWEFPDWDAEDCAGFVCKRAEEHGIALDANGSLMHTLREGFDILSGFEAEVLQPDGRFRTERQIRPGWANARDVEEGFFPKLMAARTDRVYEQAEDAPQFIAADAQKAFDEMLRNRPEGVSRRTLQDDAAGLVNLAENLNSAMLRGQEQMQQQRRQQQQPVVRVVEDEERIQDLTQQDNEAVDQAAVDQAAVEEEWEEQSEDKKRETLEADEQLAKEEDERLAKLAQQAHDEAVRKAAELERRQRQKLRQMTPCPVGFMWYKCGGGWRCGGGSHFVSDAALERSMG